MPLGIHLVITAFFAALGIVFARGKGAGLIAGYNTASAREKAKYNEKALCKGMAKLMFALAACWLVVASSEVFHTMALLWIGLALFLGVIIIGVILLNTDSRYKE